MVKMKSAVVAWAMGCVGAVLLAGCESESIDNQGTVSLAELQGLAVPTEPTDPGTTIPTGTNTVDATYPAEIDGPIHWLHTNVSSWPVTSSLHASVGSTISFPYSKANVWPAVDGVNANPWVIVKWTDGKWYAATFEWLRKGQLIEGWRIEDIAQDRVQLRKGNRQQVLLLRDDLAVLKTTRPARSRQKGRGDALPAATAEPAEPEPAEANDAPSE